MKGAKHEGKSEGSLSDCRNACDVSRAGDRWQLARPLGPVEKRLRGLDGKRQPW